MSIVTIRANQNSFNFNQTGGTRDPLYELQDRVAFVDAVERQDATILNQTKKGAASNLVKPRWGVRTVNPRGTQFGAQCLAGDALVTVPSGHSARLQQGHVLRCTRASDGAVEHMIVNDDPALVTATVHRAQGGTTALQFEIGDKIKIIGIALPEGADFPLSPVSRGQEFFNRWQFFGGSLVHTLESDTSPSVDNLSGSLMSKDTLQVVKDMKLNLSETLLYGRRQNGDPSRQRRFHP